MNLLPRSSSQFSSTSYWNQFFAQRGDKAFEWYAEFTQLYPLISKYVKTQDRVIVVGAGNSSLSPYLYDAGYTHITSIDVSNNVVNSMNKKHCGLKNGRGDDFTYLALDCTVKMDLFEDETFSICIDKGTLDALSSDDTMRKADGMLSEISRLLKPLGRYLCISLLQEHILLRLVDFFSSGSWLVRIHRCRDAENETLVNCAKKGANKNPLVLPVFLLVATKLKGLTTVFETIFDDDIHAKPTRYKSTDELINAVLELQKFAVLQQRIRSDDPVGENGEQLNVELFGSTSYITARYIIYIVNTGKKSVSKSKKSASRLNQAVFIVPQGREVEWLFSTDEGRLQLATQIQCNRLLVVHLGRSQIFDDLEQVKSELSDKIADLTPVDLMEEIALKRVPFLTTDTTGGIGKRVIRHEGESALNGRYVIEDVVVSQAGEEQEMFRRLIFLANQNIIQSEAKLKKDGTLDNSFLACNHHRYIVVRLLQLIGLIKNMDTTFNILLIGLGGGCLASFVINNLSKSLPVHLTAVDMDPAMLSVSNEWFNLKQASDRKRSKLKLNVEIQEGVSFLQQERDKCNNYDVIIFDVDSKQHSDGLSCPPASFLEDDVLQTVLELLQAKNGTFLLNLVTRNDRLRADVTSKLCSHFNGGFSYRMEPDLNHILSMQVVEKSNKPDDDQFDTCLKVIDTSTHALLIDARSEMMKSVTTL